MALIFNSVTKFIEQVGRRQQWKYAELDVLVSIWNGPQATALQFKPQIGTPHPSFPLMFCTDSQITNREALIADVEATYQGIMQAKKGPYYTPPVTTESPVQGSRDFVQFWAAPVGNPGLAITGQGPSGVSLISLYNCGTQTTTVRYIGTQCAVRYQAYPRPGGLIYSSVGLSRVKWTILTQLYGPLVTSASGVLQGQMQQIQAQIPPLPPLLAKNLGVSRVQKGQWYDCTETYGPTF